MLAGSAHSAKTGGVVDIEMPEATVLARRIRAEFPGKTVAGFELQGCESLQRMGFEGCGLRDT